MLVTNQKEMVKCAKYCYLNFPTIVNKIKESTILYSNSKDDYAKMDNKFSGSRMSIGWSSNLAQLSMTYYWTELAKEKPNENLLQEYYDNFVILSVLAQVAIDSCKRIYEIDAEVEIKRISKLPSMQMKRITHDKNGKAKYIQCDYPKFMKYTKEIKLTKDGKEISSDIILENKQKLKKRINKNLICPMNWLNEYLDKIQNAPNTKATPINDFFIKMNGESNRRQISKICKLVDEYDRYMKHYSILSSGGIDVINQMIEITDEILEKLKKIKISNLITINRLIETAFGIETNNNLFYKHNQRYSRRMLNLLYKANKHNFLRNFVKK